MMRTIKGSRKDKIKYDKIQDLWSNLIWDFLDTFPKLFWLLLSLSIKF